MGSLMAIYQRQFRANCTIESIANTLEVDRSEEYRQLIRYISGRSKSPPSTAMTISPLKIFIRPEYFIPGLLASIFLVSFTAIAFFPNTFLSYLSETMTGVFEVSAGGWIGVLSGAGAFLFAVVTLQLVYLIQWRSSLDKLVHDQGSSVDWAAYFEEKLLASRMIANLAAALASAAAFSIGYPLAQVISPLILEFFAIDFKSLLPFGFLAFALIGHSFISAFVSMFEFLLKITFLDASDR